MQKRYWAIVPAAGVGKRMQADRPKQYLALHNKTVIEYALDRLLSLDEITGVVLSISETDDYWQDLNYKSKKPLFIARGGTQRSDSVLNALKLLETKVDNNDSIWVLVHDAARPCVRINDIKKLIKYASDSDNGGLLALPVRDTMKRASDNGKNKIKQTVCREGLWHALTPQMFKLHLLKAALINAEKNNQPITDDASAMELAGYSPVLIEAQEDNIKITRGFDLKLAELFLLNQSS